MQGHMGLVIIFYFIIHSSFYLFNIFFSSWKRELLNELKPRNNVLENHGGTVHNEFNEGRTRGRNCEMIVTS